jgi:hypothetical protein
VPSKPCLKSERVLPKKQRFESALFRHPIFPLPCV